MDKKNIIMIMTIVLLITLVIGTGITSAYFMVSIKNDTEPTSIETSIGKNAKVELTQGVSELKLNIKPSDMSMTNAIHEVEYYADNVNDYITTQKDGMKTLGTLSIKDSEPGLVYKCSANIKVEVTNKDNNNSMIKAIQEGDGEIYLRGGDLIIKEDLINIQSGNKTYPINFILESYQDENMDNNQTSLLGYIKLNNRTDKDQSYIMGKELKVNITTDTLNCYTLQEHPIITKLRSTDSNKTLSSHLTGGMYRYQGLANKVTNNYVCLGSDCSQNTDKMYRIIGITPEGKMKLIKKEALESTYQWGNSNEDIKWSNSLIYQAINGDDFLNKTEYISEDWKSKIKDTNWIYGDMYPYGNTGGSQNGIDIYNIENGLKLVRSLIKSTEENGGLYSSQYNVYYKDIIGYWINNVISKFSLMSVGDYYLSESNIASCPNAGSACRGWLNLLENDIEPIQQNEYTMVRIGYYFDANGEAYRALPITNASTIAPWSIGNYLSIRPVFYLQNDIIISSGKGSIIEPFVLSIS